MIQRARRTLPCAVPPHILREIAQRGDARQRAWALGTLARSEQMRGRRMALGPPAAAAPAAGKRRTIFDAGNGTTLPGKRVRAEGDPPTDDPAVTEAYDGAGVTYDLFLEEFGRNSVDDRGMRLDATVHYGRDYDNAFWDGAQMVYGDGDGEIFGRFTRCVDVIAHELAHGVTQFEARLAYSGQSGALNEHFSDVFGALAKQRSLGQTAGQADWLIGQGLFMPAVNGLALRSMKAPGTAYDDPLLGKDPQPGHMDHYQDLDWDDGGVHVNSGIPNRAFYLASVEIGGLAWKTTGRIWYNALRDELRPRGTFRHAALATLNVAAKLFGEGSLEQQAVRAAWEEVGVTA